METTYKSERVSIKEAAKRIGCGEGYIRMKMRNGEWNIGEATPPSKGRANWSFRIFRQPFERAMKEGKLR